MGDIVVLTVVAVIIVFAFRSLKKGGSCSGNCSTCMSGSCDIDWNEIHQKIKAEES